MRICTLEGDGSYPGGLRARTLGDECSDAVIVTTGRHGYRRPDGIAVVPAALLGPSTRAEKRAYAPPEPPRRRPARGSQTARANRYPEYDTRKE